MFSQEWKQNITEFNFLLFTGDHVRNILHSNAFGTIYPPLKWQGRSWAGDYVFSRMNNQSWRLNQLQTFHGIVSQARLDQAFMRSVIVF